MERARDAAPIRLPTHIEALINEAISYNWMGMGAEARAAAEKALALDPASVNAWITLGNAFRNEGRFDEARRATERAYALDPSSEISMVNLAHLSSKLGDTDAVRKWIGIALEHARRSDRFAFLEGMLYELVELGRLDEAIDYADLVLRENPFAVMALNTRAIALRRLRRLSEALQTIERALELNPAYAKGWSNRATIELELEQFAHAIASADRALSFDASLGGPYLAKASASLMLGRLDEAIATLSAGAQARPGDRRLSEALAQYRAITTEELDGLRSLQR